MAYGLTIKKNAGGWIVERSSGSGAGKPGDTVTWTIESSEPATAHLQFLNDIFDPSVRLDNHWVGVVKQGENLELTLSSKAMCDPRVLKRTHGYAVAVVDASGVRYAFGNNPPPELEVGD